MVSRYLGHAVHDQLLTMSVRPQQIQAAVFKEVDGEEASNLNGISKVELHQVPSNKGIISDQRVGIRRIAGERSRVGLETRSHNKLRGRRKTRWITGVVYMMMGPDNGADRFQRDTICAKLIGNIMFNFQDRLGRFDLVEDLQCQPQSAYMMGYHVRHRVTSPEMGLEIAIQAYWQVAAFLSNLFLVRGQKEPFHCYSCFRSRSCSTAY